MTAWRAGIGERWGYRVSLRGPLLTRAVAPPGRVHQAAYFQHLTDALGFPRDGRTFLVCRDALERRESCGGHFREEYQSPDGEAQRDDAHFSHAAAWEYLGPDQTPKRHIEPLTFEHVKPTARSYK